MMNLDHLIYFCDAVHFESVAKSAKVNHVSSGAISQAIKKLESDFGQPLLHHKKRNFEPTIHGRQVYRQCAPLIADFLKVQTQIRNADCFEGEFTFATQQSIAENLLAKPISEFKKNFEDVHPLLSTGHTSSTLQKLENREVEFAILLDNVDLAKYSQRTLFKGDFVLYQGSCVHSDIFITTLQTPEVDFFKRKYQARHQNSPNIIMQISSWSLLKKLADEGVGVALIPDYILNPKERKNTSIEYPNGELNKYSINIAWPTDRPLSHLASAFIETCQEQIWEQKIARQ